MHQKYAKNTLKMPQKYTKNLKNAAKIPQNDSKNALKNAPKPPQKMHQKCANNTQKKNHKNATTGTHSITTAEHAWQGRCHRQGAAPPGCGFEDHS